MQQLHSELVHCQVAYEQTESRRLELVSIAIAIAYGHDELILNTNLYSDLLIEIHSILLVRI